MKLVFMVNQLKQQMMELERLYHRQQHGLDKMKEKSRMDDVAIALMKQGLKRTQGDLDATTLKNDHEISALQADLQTIHEVQGYPYQIPRPNDDWRT